LSSELGSGVGRRWRVVASILFLLTACVRGGTNRTCFGWRTPDRFEPIDCASTAIRPEELALWVGRPAGALEKAWGPATREVVDDTFKVLVYEQFETSGRVTGGVRARPSYVRSYLFWVDASGTVTRVETRGAP
jgi:hypothetical protein